MPSIPTKPTEAPASVPSPSQSLLVDTKTQTLRVVGESGDGPVYPVSTSKFGLGFEEGSFRTPTGRFRIAEKIGQDAPIEVMREGRKVILTVNPAPDN